MKFLKGFEEYQTKYDFYEGIIDELVKTSDKSFN